MLEGQVEPPATHRRAPVRPPPTPGSPVNLQAHAWADGRGGGPLRQSSASVTPPLRETCVRPACSASGLARRASWKRSRCVVQGRDARGTSTKLRL
ncbi:hypothetical protein AAFF_G00356590 [Aldrovandia affinis]|uniref:Uncharacterized protein n=1 Tax=Aldrovandia affinis TaxID=143900 RepID=A0AAD7T8J8_9TELE|nr:hypothetical protein AAFF_G00356590 [Aldrovandia affinis]